MLSVVVALVTLGAWSARSTVIVAVAVGPPSPVVVGRRRFLNLEAAVASEFERRRELQPGRSLGHGDELPLVIWVVPSF